MGQWARVLLTTAALVALASCTPLTGSNPDTGLEDANANDARDMVVSTDVATCPTAPNGGPPGTPDPTFGGVNEDPRLENLLLKGATNDAEGRIYAFGVLESCVAPGSREDIAVLRLDADGAVDETFGDRGLACMDDGGDDVPLAIAIDRRGGVLLGGLHWINLTRGRSGAMVARLDARGIADPGFGPGGVRQLPIGIAPDTPGASVLDVLAEDGGTIVVAGGERDSFNGGSYGVVQRLLADGTPDPTFRSGEPWIDPTSEGFASIAAFPGGGYAVAGTARNLHSRVVMLGHDGEPDARFGASGFATHNETVLTRSARLDQRGGIILGGQAHPSPSAGLVRFDATGAQDPTFGSDGLAVVRTYWDVGFGLDAVLASQCSGHLLVTGTIDSFTVQLERLLPDGRRDRTFGSDGLVVIPNRSVPQRPFRPFAVLLDPRDGRITVVTSSNYGTGLALWRFSP